MSNPQVIDISHWNGFPDFEAVAECGVVGVILKATEGTSYVDPNRAQNYVAATKAGLKACCYMWLKPGNGAQQAAFFIDTVDPVDGERVVIDYEESGCTLDMLKAAVAELLAYDPTLQVTVYSGNLLKEQLGNSCDQYLADNTDLWLAQYTSDFNSISWPTGTYSSWTLHQYSQSGQVDGCDGNVDLDRFNGSDEDCIAWLSPAGAEPAPAPEPEAQLVSIDVTVPDGVKLVITVNGDQV